MEPNFAHKGLPGARIALTAFALGFTSIVLWLHHEWKTWAPKHLVSLLPNISSVEDYSIQIPHAADQDNEGNLAGSATLPVDVFVRAARSAQYSEINQPSPEVGYFATLNHPDALRARLDENHFAFETMDGYSIVTGPDGEEYRRKFKAARDTALADLKAQLAPSRVQP